MKLKATITATINIKGTNEPAEDADRVIEKLANVCSKWLAGEAAPQIKIEYTLPTEDTIIRKEDIN
tara:strand:+ start:2553 stop:2750 length:198 start_codon:yes stop_codon:yes gene_type:complete